MTYPYANKPSSLKEYLEKIPTLAVPSKVTIQTLASLGFKSKNDRTIIPILKFINFLDSSGQPNDNYINFRSKDKAGGVMAQCVRTAYSELFGLYEDANKRTSDELRDFFSQKVKGGEPVLIRTVNTFKMLCDFADFNSKYVKVTPEKGSPQQDTDNNGNGQRSSLIPEGLAINMNIQITLPITEDAKVYENIFKAIREQLFKQS
jgi:hypothetical protein